MDPNTRSSLLVNLVQVTAHAAWADREQAETHLRTLIDALADAGIHPASVEIVEDQHNNVGRNCTVNGTRVGRVWQVEAAVAGGRYLVRNTVTGETRSVPHRAMSNLY